MVKGAKFDPATSIAPGTLTGKVLLVTGGNSGLGKQSILDLVKHSPARIFLTARSESKAKEAIELIAAAAPDVPASTIIQPLVLDLSSLASVRDAAKQVLDNSDRLDILMLNAGIMAPPKPALTKDGYEEQFGTNHMGHALFAKLLLPLLLSTAEKPGSDVRVVTMSSDMWSMHPKGGVQLDKVKTMQDDIYTTTRYGQSKLANALFTREMARRYPKITTVSIHPGVVGTNLGADFQESYKIAKWLVNTVGKYLMKTVEDGAKNQEWAATTSKENLENGAFYMPVGKKHVGGIKDDADLAKRQWEWTEKELEKWSL